MNIFWWLSTFELSCPKGPIKNKKKVEIYLQDKGQLVYEKNREKSRKPLKIHKCSEEFLKYVEDSIKQEKWSVDETISRAKKQGKYEVIPSYKTIYNYIEKGILKIKNIDLPLKVKIKNSNKIERKNSKIYGTSISQRLQYYRKKTRIWAFWRRYSTRQEEKGRSNPITCRKEDKIQHICKSKR